MFRFAQWGLWPRTTIFRSTTVCLRRTGNRHAAGEAAPFVGRMNHVRTV